MIQRRCGKICQYVLVCLVIFGSFLLAGEICYLSIVVARLLALVIAALLSVWSLQTAYKRNSWHPLGLSAIGVSLILLSVTQWPSLQIVFYSSCFLACSFVSPDQLTKSLYQRVGAGILLGGTLLAVLKLVPLGLLLTDIVTTKFSSLINGTVSNASLGAYNGGFTSLLLLLCFLLPVQFGRSRKLLAGILVLCGLFVIHVFVQGFVVTSLLRDVRVTNSGLALML